MRLRSRADAEPVEYAASRITVGPYHGREASHRRIGANHVSPAQLGLRHRAERADCDEPAGSGELFPHIYGPINPEAVVATQPLQRGPDGRWTFEVKP